MLSNDAIEYIKARLPLPDTDEQTAYNAGYNCGAHGATLENCHFTLFSSPEATAAWSEGKADAEAGRPNKYVKQ